MIEWVERQAVFAQYRTIASEITKLQNVIFDEDMLANYQAEGEEADYLERFDCYEQEVADYPSFHSILKLPCQNIEQFPNLIAKKLAQLFEHLQANEIIVVAHLKLDFFGNLQHVYPPMMKACKKLKRIVGSDSYKERFCLKRHDLSELLSILFWLIRYDASIPEYIFLFDNEQKISVNLCHYNNVHISQFGEEMLLENLLNSWGWQVLKGVETDNFTDNEITKRRLKL